jgi:hypothetical protein
VTARATIDDLPGLVRKRLGLGWWFRRSGTVTSVEPVAGDGVQLGSDWPGAAGEVGVTPALAGRLTRHDIPTVTIAKMNRIPRTANKL